jgi:hypothetical protein
VPAWYSAMRFEAAYHVAKNESFPAKRQ